MRTLTLSTGQQLIIRNFTEAEACRFTDKRQAALRIQERLADYLDDGDEEVLSAITSPDKAQVLALVEEYPDLPRLIGDQLREMGGDDIKIEDAALLDADRSATAHFAVRVALPSGTWYLAMRRLSRMEHKFLRYSDEARRRGRVTYAALSAAAKQHVAVLRQVLEGGLGEPMVMPASLWEEAPFFAQNLGVRLYNAATVRVEADEGK
jgi:hypothetical protein